MEIISAAILSDGLRTWLASSASKWSGRFPNGQKYSGRLPITRSQIARHGLDGLRIARNRLLRQPCSVTQALFRRRRCWCQAGTHPRQFCATSFARNGLHGFPEKVGDCDCCNNRVLQRRLYFGDAASGAKLELIRGKFCPTASELGLLPGR